MFPTEQGTITWVSVFMDDNLDTLVLVTNQIDQMRGQAPSLSQVTIDAVAGTLHQIAVDGAVGIFDSATSRGTTPALRGQGTVAMMRAIRRTCAGRPRKR
jgi:hypothetical protein